MKPQWIFTAVGTIAILMFLVLPRAIQASPATDASTGVLVMNQNHVSADQPTAEANPTLVDQPAADVQPEAIDQSPPIEQPAVAELPMVEPTTHPHAAAAGIPQSAVDPSVNQDLQEFVQSVFNNQPGELVGVYIAGLFALPVVEQPVGDDNFVSQQEKVLTRYGAPSQHGVTALLAHNYLSGRLFFQIKPAQEIVLVYGDGQLAHYQVSGIQNYQALSPHDVRSDFRDLNGPGGQIIPYSELFGRVYTRADTVVFQTCIEANGESSWGRLFIIADPLT